MASPNQISPAQLSRLIGTAKCPTIVDVRIDEDFDDDPRLIPTALRHPFDDVEALVERLRGKHTVVYCQKGLKLSEGAVAMLRHHGLHVEVLSGGQFGWRDAELPMVEVKVIPIGDPFKGSLWVTRHRPKIDRIACPWFIRRFVDPSARFLFVAPSQVLQVAEKFGATPFDVEDVFWSHRGEQCTFDTMVAEFGFTGKDTASTALRHLATIVRGADTNRHDLAPEAAGLMAASLGLSRMYKDDLEQLEAGMGLYDAFYRWARDALDEGHDWPNPSVAKKAVAT